VCNAQKNKQEEISKVLGGSGWERDSSGLWRRHYRYHPHSSHGSLTIAISRQSIPIGCQSFTLSS